MTKRKHTLQALNGAVDRPAQAIECKNVGGFPSRSGDGIARIFRCLSTTLFRSRRGLPNGHHEPGVASGKVRTA